MGQHHYFIEPHYSVGSTCAAAWNLVKNHPTVPICFGCTIAFTVFAMRLSTSSPRWKGAPVLIGQNKKKEDVNLSFSFTSLHQDFVSDETNSVVTSSTINETLPLVLSSDDDGTLHIVVDNVDSVSSFLRFSQKLCYSFYEQFCCAQCKRSVTTFYNLGDFTTLMPNISEENFPCAKDKNNYICKNFNSCLTNDESSINSGGNCCGNCGGGGVFCEKCAFGAALVYFSGDNRTCQTNKVAMTLPQCDSDNIIMPNVVINNPHILKDDCNFLELRNKVNFTALNKDVEQEGDCRLGGLIGKFEYIEGDQALKGDLQRSLFCNSGEGSLNFSLQLGSSHHIVNNNENGFHQQTQQRPICVSIERAAWDRGFCKMPESTGKYVFKKGAVCRFVSSENSLCNASCAVENYKDENDTEIKKQDLFNKLPKLEEQLKSLETRLEQQQQQQRSLIGGCSDAAGLESSCNDVQSVESLPKPVTHVLYASLTESSERGVGSSQLSQPQQSARMTKDADWADSSGTRQHDRRIDDVFVRHHNDCTAPYLLSLTYHDAHGSLRTINTQKLPALKLSPRQSAVAPSGAVVTDASSTVRGQPPRSLCPPKVATYDASRLHAAQVGCGAGGGGGGAKASRGLFVAPLPPLGPAKGSCFPDVVGMNDKFRIGAFLGGGGCGKVYECLNTETGEVFAVKQVLFDPKDPKLRSRLRQLKLEKEVLTLAARHCMPWIVGFYGTEKHGHSALMFLEYCAKGSLLDYMLSGGSTTQFQPQRSVEVPPAAGVAGVGQSHLPSGSVGGGELSQQDPEKEKTAGRGGGGGGTAGAKDLPLGVFPSFPPFTGTDVSAKNNNDVFAEMPPFSISEVQRFTRQIVEALYFLHFHGYAHLDVKTANILVTEEGDTRLADFGCSMRLRQNVSCSFCDLATQHVDDLIDEAATPTSTTAANTSSNSNKNSSGGGAQPSERHDALALPYAVLDEVDAITELRGTALYIAPEMVRFERERIGTAGDIWSLGCVVMELATGAAPWRHVAVDKLRVLYCVASAREELPLPPSVLRAAEEAARWLSSADAADEAVDCDKLTGVARKQSRLESEVCEGGAAVCSSDRKDNNKHREQMHLWVALKDFLSFCLRIRPEERPSCEDLLQHPFLNFN